MTHPTPAQNCDYCGIERDLFALSGVFAPDGADVALCADCERRLRSGAIACLSPREHGLCDCAMGACLSAREARAVVRASAAAWA